MIQQRGAAYDIGHAKSVVLDFFAGLTDPDKIWPGMGLSELGENQNRNPCVPKDAFVTGYADYLDRFLVEFGAAKNGRIEDLAIHRRAHIYAIYHAYESALGRDMSEKRCVVYPAHSCVRQDLLDLMEDFEPVYFLHMVRNPINNLNSVFKYYLKIRTVDDPTNDMLSSGLHAMFLDRALTTGIAGREHERLHGIYFYSDSARPKSRAVRLEDVHGDPAQVMRSIIEWAGLAWNDALLESTFAGLRWWNRPGLARVSGFDKRIVSKDTNVFTNAFDEERLVFIGRPIFDMYYPGRSRKRRGFGYSLRMLGACMLPFSMEIKHFYSVRARIMFARHLKSIWRSLAVAVQKDAQKEFESKRAEFDPAAHVLTRLKEVALAESVEATKLYEPVTLIWRFVKSDGTLGQFEIKGQFPRPVPGVNEYIVHDLNFIQANYVPRQPDRMVSDFVKRVAHRYSFALDYFYHRYLIVKAVMFVRLNKGYQIPPLIDREHP